MSDFHSETPTSYDLARWLFEKVSNKEPCSSREEMLGLMAQCMTITRSPTKERVNSRTGEIE